MTLVLFHWRVFHIPDSQGRGLTQNDIELLSQPIVKAAFAAEIETSEETVYLWTGIGNIKWNDKLYIGTGEFINISPFEESGDLSANNFTLTLNSTENVFRARMLLDIRSDKNANILLFLFNDLWEIQNGFIIFRGKTDTATINVTSGSIDSSLLIENVFNGLEQRIDRRWDSQDQKIRDSNDTGFDQMAALQDKTIKWG